ncbi:MAG: glycyl-radical enzyme activating protein [Marinilabiliales bacterium]|nr:MAG: glycyl-radical enzyme activating protein [Marinilabiliales bacterium]
MTNGLVFDIRRYSVHDGPGIRTTVFFKGCPMKCTWCHNPEGISPEQQEITRTRRLNGKSKNYQDAVGRLMTPAEVMADVIKDQIFYEESGGGVTFSGGEPLMQYEFLMSLLLLCRGRGLHTAVDTSGHAPPDQFNRVAENTDLMLYDLKTADAGKHSSFTGQDNSLIIANLEALDGAGPRVIIRIPLIPDFNCTVKDMEGLRDLISATEARVARIDLLPWHRLGNEKYKKLGMVPPATTEKVTDGEQTNMLKEVFTRSGYNVKIGG